MDTCKKYIFYIIWKYFYYSSQPNEERRVEILQYNSYNNNYNQDYPNDDTYKHSRLSNNPNYIHDNIKPETAIEKGEIVEKNLPNSLKKSGDNNNNETNINNDNNIKYGNNIDNENNQQW